MALHGQSGVGVAGLLPLNYSTIFAWRDLEEIDIQPHEVQALLIIDKTMLYPSDEEEK